MLGYDKPRSMDPTQMNGNTSAPEPHSGKKRAIDLNYTGVMARLSCSVGSATANINYGCCGN